RTSPRVPQPGRFSTFSGWRDPFDLLAQEDPEGKEISSVLAQAAVPAEFSGAARRTMKRWLVEGVRGSGDEFMLGRRGPVPLSRAIARDVIAAVEHLGKQLGDVRCEWVHDGRQAWIVQLHLA